MTNRSSAYHFDGLWLGGACRDPREKLVGDVQRNKIQNFLETARYTRRNGKWWDGLASWSVLTHVTLGLDHLIPLLQLASRPCLISHLDFS